MAEKQFILFTLNDEIFATHVEHVVSITDLGHLSKIPNASDYIEGLLNLRGDPIPVVNLKKRFGLPDTQKENRRIIISLIDGTQVGYLVDDASKSMSKQDDEVLPPPQIALGVDNHFVTEVCIDNGGLVLVIDLKKVLTTSEISDIHEQLQ